MFIHNRCFVISFLYQNTGNAPYISGTSVLACRFLKIDCVFIMLWSLHLVSLQVVEDPIPIRGGRLCLIVYGLMRSVETKRCSISLTVSDLIFRRKRVEYSLGFKGRNKIEQASLTFCLLLEFLWNRMICDLTMPLKVWCGWNDLQWRSWCVSVGLTWCFKMCTFVDCYIKKINWFVWNCSLNFYIVILLV